MSDYSQHVFYVHISAEGDLYSLESWTWGHYDNWKYSVLVTAYTVEYLVVKWLKLFIIFLLDLALLIFNFKKCMSNNFKVIFAGNPYIIYILLG